MHAMHSGYQVNLLTDVESSKLLANNFFLTDDMKLSYQMYTEKTDLF
jgi:hypothetical protein